jgi:hypothetical protein
MPLPIAGALIVLYGFRNLLARGPVMDADTIDAEKCAPEEKS